MSFSDVLNSGKFLITTDVIPPKGINISKMLGRIDSLVGKVDAVNVADLPSSVMRVSPLAIALLLKERRLEPILQMTCRDRNRLALQADLLGGYIMGITNILALTGDEIHLSDDPEAKPVFDLNSIELLKAARKLEKGYDLAGNPLRGLPKFCIGAVVDPGANPVEPEIEKMQQKVEAGAEFIQTQVVYDIDMTIDFLREIQKYNVPVFLGIFPMKSYGIAKGFDMFVPGVDVPKDILERWKRVKTDVIDKKEQKETYDQLNYEFFKPFITELKSKGLLAGVHCMAVHYTRIFPKLIDVIKE